MVVFALTRWPGLMPANFSATYALAFCAGVYFSKKWAWWLPLVTLLCTDLAINSFYQHRYEADPAQYAAPMEFFNPYLVANYLGYAFLIWLGTRIKPSSSWTRLLGGGIAGALVFYLISNTASWLQFPGYQKTLAGWIQALTTGLPGWPPTWMFLLKTLFSGGLFTGLFVGAMKLSEATETEETEEETEEEAEAEQPEAEPDQAPA